MKKLKLKCNKECVFDSISVRKGPSKIIKVGVIDVCGVSKCVSASDGVSLLETSTLTITVPIPEEQKKVNLSFYLHTSLWYLKRFYEGLKDLHKTFSGGAKKCEYTM